MVRNTLLFIAALPLVAQVNIVKETGRIKVEIDGKPFTDFYIGSDLAKPYLHPLRSASGKIVTRRWPMEAGFDEANDHPHHKGVFFGHQDVNKTNFWANEPAGRANDLGKIVLKEVLQAKGGKRSGTIVTSFNWNDPKGKLVLTEKRTMTFYAGGDTRVIDFDFLLVPNGKVVFGDEKDGLFAVRVHKGLQEEKSIGRMVNEQGAETEKQVWGKPSDWVDFQGKVEDEAMGIAIFDHPENLRHPTRWHARGYGLFSVNPFCLAAFTNDKTQNGQYVLEADKTLRLRYRLVIHPGNAKAADIAGQYKKYAALKK